MESKISQLIKSRRNELNLTLEEVAKACGVEKSTVSKWEKGQIRNMRSDKVKPLCDILEIDIKTFVQEGIVNESSYDLSYNKKILMDSIPDLPESTVIAINALIASMKVNSGDD